ncbi:RNA-binding domain-containing protein [Hymenobacter rubripertinctus]|uniref:ATP-binding protein n=1 Tax=Hymenobacter rubripertinctus TaxID=2029981 RepID=A0A418R777_9BACT|nr:ATP-binding protein [Hymenobacter rubripertinctus]RIY13440.1 ATP-binding protein [Hymenobacter rubripertinctus]
MDLLELIRQGEGERLEFKQRTTRPTRMARTLSSLANTHGGRVLVGVEDNGRITGVRDVEEELYQLREAARHYIDPPLEFTYQEMEAGEGRVVLVVTVPESAHKPHRAQIADGDWRAYVRVRDQSVQTSQLTEKALERQEPPNEFEQIPLSREELAVLEYLRQHPRITLAQYMKLLNIGQRRAYRLLIKLTLHGYIKHHDKQKEVYYTL